MRFDTLELLPRSTFNPSTPPSVDRRTSFDADPVATISFTTDYSGAG